MIELLKTVIVMCSPGNCGLLTVTYTTLGESSAYNFCSTL